MSEDVYLAGQHIAKSLQVVIESSMFLGNEIGDWGPYADEQTFGAKTEVGPILASGPQRVDVNGKTPHIHHDTSRLVPCGVFGTFV